MSRQPSVAIVGAGMGGMAVAGALRHVGIDADIYEQAPEFGRIGAGIQVTPNAIKVLRETGVEADLRLRSFEPQSQLTRDAFTGEVRGELPMAEDQYGAPYLCMHRADLHGSLASVVPAERVHLGKELAGLEPVPAGARLSFADGTSVTADLVIGADGMHSVVREQLLGEVAPAHNGRVAYRAVFSAELLDRDLGDSRTVWSGGGRSIIVYYTTPAKSELYFVTSLPESGDSLADDSWSAKGDVNELRAAYEDFHEDVRAMLAACPDTHKWATPELDPLPRWSDGRVVLLGDACHPMPPRMAQGAAQSIEDAAVLARCIADVDGEDVEGALTRYELHRKPRTSLVQALARAQNMAGRRGDRDASWLYAYDAWTVDIDSPPVQPESTVAAI